MYVRAPTSFRTAHEDDIDWLCIGEVLWQLGDIYCMCCQLILWDLFGSCMMCARTRVCVCAGFLSQSTPQRIPIIHRWHRGNLLGTFLCIFQQCLKPRKKTVMCVFSTQQQCVCVFYAFFFLIVKIDSSSIPLINEIAGKNKPICHLPINGNHSSLQRCPSRERQLRFGSGVDQSGGMTTTN